MIWIISDIHGCYHTLVKLIDKVKQLDAKASFVFVGDYIDRGLYNKEVIDYVIKMQADGAICLCGNHDEIVNWILNKQSFSDASEWVVGQPTFKNVIPWWRINGFDETLASYGVTSHTGLCTFDLPYQYNGVYATQDPRKIGDDFCAAVPDDHKEFFNSLKLYWENDTHFACHGFMRPNEDLPRSLKFLPSDMANEVLWCRFPETCPSGMNTTTVWDKIGVFGHTPVSCYGAVTPIKFDQIRLIDTGVFMGNYLCAYCCDTDDHLLQATVNKDIRKDYPGFDQ